MRRKKSKTPSALRVLCGELEDMSVLKDEVSIMRVRERLEPAVAEAEGREKILLDAIKAVETDQLVASNIEATKNIYGLGLSKAARAIKAGNADLALATIQAALAFHPMYAESWPGWPGWPGEDSHV